MSGVLIICIPFITHGNLPISCFKAQSMIEKQKMAPVPEDKRDHYNDSASEYWDKFYSLHTNSFFKDRVSWRIAIRGL